MKSCTDLKIKWDFFFFNECSGYYGPKGNLTCDASGIVLGAEG